MVTIEELKLGNRTLEALKFLLSQITELETAISQIDISEIKDANTLTKEQIATLQDVKNAVETINSDLSLKKSDFDEKKQNFDTNMNAFRNDKADFDEKKADFDSKNNTALSNFAFIASNVEKINKTSDLLAEAKSILETIKPIEQKAQTALETLANSQNKFTELDALKTTLLELKKSLEKISTNGLINDTSASATTTYSSVKIDSLLVAKLDASEKNKYVSLENGKIKSELLPDINAITLNGKSSDVFELKDESTSKYTALSQSISTLETSLNSGLNSLSNSLKDKIASNLKGAANGLATLDNSGKVPSSQLPKIDTYTKQESDNNFVAKTDIATETKVGITKIKNIINAKQTDAAVTEKAVSDLIEANKSIGVDQTWQDVTSQRKSGIVYTNTTGRPIMVAITTGESAGGSRPTMVINGSIRFEFSAAVANYAAQTCYFIIPNGMTYKIENLATPTIVAHKWLELR